jgi:hypothetical protein
LISNFEYLVLASAVRLGDDAYGASVMKEIAEATGKPCSSGAYNVARPEMATSQE